MAKILAKSKRGELPFLGPLMIIQNSFMNQVRTTDLIYDFHCGDLHDIEE
jgi:hypothetical protein